MGRSELRKIEGNQGEISIFQWEGNSITIIINCQIVTGSRDPSKKEGASKSYWLAVRLSVKN